MQPNFFHTRAGAGMGGKQRSAMKMRSAAECSRFANQAIE